ncbi:MAG: Stk1 family PASTA domain-containing Ser/Thr kinase [Clostridia bacterium]|nr:Stk1 family PASTA domain-containing Ser/Thr kinase [Clostridia bacterium]
MDKYVGKRLDGRYEIQEIIGVGGMAVVYKAFDNQENRIVAIKILKDEFTSNQEFIRRFKNESKAIAMLSHQNIVNVYDVSFGDLIQYIVMEYIEGITLKEFIERQGSLRWKDAVHFTIQILRGLQHAHDKGIVHRDVKPQNIMVLADGTIKVTDFGIARFTRSDQRTITDKAIGSVHYISPEQARGEKTDEKSDIYSVGVMLYEMITGQMPFQADSAVSVAIMQLQREPKSPTEINGSIPEGLEQITMHAMQKTPERRYQSSAEMLCDLDAFRKDPAITFGYNYFVDDSPTRFVGGVVEKEPVVEMEEEDEKEKSSIIPILTGVAVTLVLALVVLGIIFIPKFLNGSTAEIACPDFVGKQYEEILDNDEYVANFKFEDEWDHSEDYEYGYVFEQSENAGEMLKKGANITLYISMGQNTKTVPDVMDKSESAAKTLLESQGFKTTIVEMEDEEIEKGKVIRTEPQVGKVVEPNAKITIYVSTGKPEKKVAVPDVTGMTEEDAKNKLEEEKFTVKTETVLLGASDKYQSVGIVAKQSPDNSVKDAAEGSEVVIYVCDGYKADVEVSLPEDLNETWGTYSISLWEKGTMVHSGDTIDGLARKNYVFKDFVTKSEKTEVIVKVSVDGSNWFDYCSITVNNINGKQTEQKYTEYKDLVSQYKNNQSSSESSEASE